MVLVHTQESTKSLPCENIFVNKIEPLITVPENGDIIF